MQIKSDSKRTDLSYVKFDYSGKNSAAPELNADYHELDNEGWTIRTVAVYKDGRYGFATATEEKNAIFPEASIYPLSELDLKHNPLYEITKNDFEEQWNLAQQYIKSNL